VVAGAGLVLATLGALAQGAVDIATHPEVAAAIGLAAKAPWVGPLLIGFGAILGARRRP